MPTTVRCVSLIALTLMLLSLQGCGISSAKAKAEAAIELFHHQLNSADFEAIWNDADDAFRRATSRERYERFIEAVHRKLGRVLKTTNANWSARSFNFQTSVVLMQQTEFEHGSGTETFTYVVRAEGVKLIGYNIQSMDLIAL